VLSLVMNDGGTAPGNRMCFSADGANWTAWELFNSSKDIMTVTGQVKVYVKYADGVGNVGQAYSADLPSGPTQNQQTNQVNTTQTNQSANQTSTGQAGTQGVESAGLVATSGTQAQGEARNQQRASARQVSGSTQGPISATSIAGSRNNAAQLSLLPSEIDIAISDITVPSEANIGEPVDIILLVSNSAEIQARDCRLILESSDGFKNEQKVSLGPRSRERIKIKFIPKEEGSLKLTAGIIASPDLTERDTRNNTVSARIKIGPKTQASSVKSLASSNQSRAAIEARPVDIAVNDIIAPSQIFLGKPAEIFILVQNDSEIELKDCQVYFETEDGFHEKQLFSIRPKAREKIVFRWTPRKNGSLKINTSINAPRGLEEKNIRNNEYRRSVEVISSESKVSADGLLREERRRDDNRR
jgi:hypothetical protein